MSLVAWLAVAGVAWVGVAVVTAVRVGVVLRGRKDEEHCL